MEYTFADLELFKIHVKKLCEENPETYLTIAYYYEQKSIVSDDIIIEQRQLINEQGDLINKQARLIDIAMESCHKWQEIVKDYRELLTGIRSHNDGIKVDKE